jgi:carboxyl-terminal processing protease
MQQLWRLGGLVLGLALSGCGGGGGGGSAAPEVPKTSTELAQICAADNFLSSDAESATKVGTLADERSWIHAYLNERYFWYKDMPIVDPKNARYNVTGGSAGQNFVTSVVNYFEDQLTPLYTATGSRVDKFSFFVDTASWTNFASGAELGYGWLLTDQGAGASRRIRVSYVYPGMQSGLAAVAGIVRGDEIVSIDGVAVNDTSRQDFIDQAISPSTAVSHSFVMQGAAGSRTLRLSASTSTLAQAEHRVVSDAAGTKWGYLIFNSHVDSAQAPLLAALTAFKSQNIDQLVVDLRYNSGGYLALASALAYGVAGPARTQGKTFETLRYNDKRSSSNENVPFYSADLDGRAIDALNFSKIYVLTTDQTCSASESFINGLRGVDVEVVQIGGTSCGKPYGFVPQDNCGITYAAMEFDGVNQKGQGGYADGLVPQCAAADDLGHALGDPAEAMFAVAIAHQRGGTCTSVAASRALGAPSLRGLGTSTFKLIRPEWQRGKILRSSKS